MTQPPIFSEEKLKELLHYTDTEHNPSYEAFKSDSYFEIQSGAKGVSKSYSGAIISIFRLVNEKIFCSLWCRNQYSHIRTTLRPMFENVLDFLKEQGLDYTPYIAIYDSGVYWTYEDGGEGRAIYFENFEKIQAFQGKTLKNKDFRFGELVIDEPIEDPQDSSKQAHELKALYEIQEKKLPLLIQNTVQRLKAPENFKIKVKFFYNIFTTDHFLVQNYHKKVIPFIDDFGNPDENILNTLINEKFVKREDKEFKKGLGLTVIMYSKFFIPENQISDQQRKSYEILKEEDYRLWLITIAGFSFQDQKNLPNYFMRNRLFKADGTYSKNVELITEMDFKNLLRNNQIMAIYDGFDAGLSDNDSWVRIALTTEAKIIIVQLINDIKTLIPKNQISRTNINAVLTELIRNSNNEIEKVLRENNSYNEFLIPDEFETELYVDNDILREWLNINFSSQKMRVRALMADRIDSRTKGFGILSRQQWQKNIFENNLISLIQGDNELLLKYLAMQLILPNEDKREEKINAPIYDLINAFEMAATTAYKIQYMRLAELSFEKSN